MCKKLLEEILNLKSSLKLFLPKIPKLRLDTITKDLHELFSNLESKTPFELQETKKLANAKLNAFKRIYGELNLEKEEEKTSDRFEKNSEGKKIPIISTDYDKFKSNKANFEIFGDPKSREDLIQIKKHFSIEDEDDISSYFDKDKINKFQKEYSNVISSIKDIEYKNQIENLREKVRNMSLEQKKEEFHNLNLNSPRWFKKEDEKNICIDEDLFRKELSEIYNIFFEVGGEEYSKNIDLTNKEFVFNENNKNEINELYSSNFMKPNENDFSSKEFKNEWTKERNIKQDDLNSNKLGLGVGDFKFDISESGEKTIQETDNSTREKFIFKDGKFIPGEGQKRKVVSLINWNSSNLDPKDVKRHRELLDRQHFMGPMWEGIEKKSIIDEPIFVNKDDYEQNTISKKEWLEIKEKAGKKHTIEEIIR